VTPDAYTLTDAKQARLRDLCDAGLCRGRGDTSAVSALCKVVGSTSQDNPAGVHPIDRFFLLAIANAAWSSDQARGVALLPLMIACVGTAEKDRSAWSGAVSLGVVRRVLAYCLRAVNLGEHARACEGASTFGAAADAARDAGNAVYKLRFALVRGPSADRYSWIGAAATVSRDATRVAAANRSPRSAIEAAGTAVSYAAAAVAIGSPDGADAVLGIAVGIGLQAYRVAA